VLNISPIALLSIILQFEGYSNKNTSSAKFAVPEALLSSRYETSISPTYASSVALSPFSSELLSGEEVSGAVLCPAVNQLR
jgi:hypothetical protein